MRALSVLFAITLMNAVSANDKPESPGMAIFLSKDKLSDCSAIYWESPIPESLRQSIRALEVGVTDRQGRILIRETRTRTAPLTRKQGNFDGIMLLPTIHAGKAWKLFVRLIYGDEIMIQNYLITAPPDSLELSPTQRKKLMPLVFVDLSGASAQIIDLIRISWPTHWAWKITWSASVKQAAGVRGYVNCTGRLLITASSGQWRNESVVTQGARQNQEIQLQGNMKLDSNAVSLPLQYKFTLEYEDKPTGRIWEAYHYGSIVNVANKM